MKYHPPRNGRREGFVTPRVADYIFIAQAVLIALVLLGVLTFMWKTNVESRQRQVESLKVSRATVRCALTQEVDLWNRVANTLGINLKALPPNTDGIDCDELMNAPIPSVSPTGEGNP